MASCIYLKLYLQLYYYRHILIESSGLTEMVGRWRCALQELDFTIGYVPGKNNEVADAMSRLCKNKMPKHIITAILTCKPIAAEIYAYLMRAHNSTVGHGGFNRTLRNLKKIGKVWEGMRHDIRAYIKQCPCCQKMSADKQKPVNHRFTTSTYAPMECINIDFIGPFPDKGYILVMVDTFTRFVKLSATTDNTAKSAVTGLIEHIGRYGAP